MGSRLDILLAQLEQLKNEIGQAYADLSKKYDFSMEGKKIAFPSMTRMHHRLMRNPLWKYIATTNIRVILSIPFIYGILIPVVLLDLALWIYQQTALRLYGVDLVDRSEYIVFDRRFLSYLNPIEKFNCLYCSYVNGVFAYAVEIGARTEQRWCPIKAAHRPKFTHSQYPQFIDYGDVESWKEKMK